MTGLSAYGETAVLSPLTTTAYVSLHTADPGNTGSSEISGAAYTRQGPVAFVNNGANPTVASNSAILTYAAATGSWGTVGYFGVWDAASGGNFRGSGALATPKTVNSGDTARFAAGALTLTAN
jgi:hypothetical protein